MSRETQAPIEGVLHIDFDDSKPAAEQPGMVFAVTLNKWLTTREKMLWRNTVMGELDAGKAARLAAAAESGEGDAELEVSIPVSKLTDANVAIADSVIASIVDGNGKAPAEVADGAVSKVDWLLDYTRNGEDVLGAVGALGMDTASPNAPSGSTKSTNGVGTKRVSRLKK